MRYYKLWPGGNTTAIIPDLKTNIDILSTAKKILRLNKDIEQVGFIRKPKLSRTSFHLQMMGGEFCGNAARAAAYLHATKNRTDQVDFTVSGYPKIIKSHVASHNVRVEIPGNFFIGQRRGRGYKAIKLYGITHFVVNGPIKGDGFEYARKLVKNRKESEQALGIIFINEKRGLVQIDPYVWVRETNTLIHETACGSGSIAAALSRGIEHQVIKQPSGEKFEVKLIYKSRKLDKVLFSGRVEYCGCKKIS